METKEHLNKIVVKCRELLAGAEKRTPGKWEQEAVCGQSFTDICAPPTQDSGNPNLIAATVSDDDDKSEKQAIKNASFIASCAGPVEAGWRARDARKHDR